MFYLTPASCMRLVRGDALEKARPAAFPQSALSFLSAGVRVRGGKQAEALAPVVPCRSSATSGPRLLRNDSMLEAILAKTGVVPSRK